MRGKMRGQLENELKSQKMFDTYGGQSRLLRLLNSKETVNNIVGRCYLQFNK